MSKDSGLASDLTRAQKRRAQLLARENALKKEIAELSKTQEQTGNSSPAKESFLRSPKCEEHLRHFIDSNIVPILRCNIHGDIVEVNDAMVRLLGYEREEYLSGKVKWTNITPPEYRELDLKAIEQLKETGRVTPFEKAYVDKNRKRIPVLVIVNAATPAVRIVSLSSSI